MIIELAGIAGGVLLIVALGPTVRWLGRRTPRIPARPPETPRANPAWRLIRSDEELREALDRAIACELASIAVLHRRAEHFASMRASGSSSQIPTLVQKRDDGSPTPLTQAQPLRKAS